MLLAIDDHPIASDAFVEYEGERVQMPEVVERKFKGDTVKLDILRDKQPMSVDVELGAGLAILHPGPQLRCAPRYVVYGGLLFQPLSLDLLEAYRISDLRVRHFFDFFVERTDLSATSRSHHSDEHPPRPDQHLFAAIPLQHRGRNQRAENRHAAGPGARL